jgi:hypothetical protein
MPAAMPDSGPEKIGVWIASAVSTTLTGLVTPHSQRTSDVAGAGHAPPYPGTYVVTALAR